MNARAAIWVSCKAKRYGRGFGRTLHGARRPDPPYRRDWTKNAPVAWTVTVFFSARRFGLHFTAAQNRWMRLQASSSTAFEVA